MTVMTRLSAASKQTPLLKSITLAMSLGALADVDFVVAVRVVGAIFFAEADTMIVADGVDGGIYALQLAPAAWITAQAFRLKEVRTVALFPRAVTEDKTAGNESC